jgi:uncharacterized membrane protein YgcG
LIVVVVGRCCCWALYGDARVCLWQWRVQARSLEGWRRYRFSACASVHACMWVRCTWLCCPNTCSVCMYVGNHLRMLHGCGLLPLRVHVVCSSAFPCVHSTRTKQAARVLEPLTEAQQQLVHEHREGRTPATLKEDAATKQLFLVEDYARPEDGRCVCPCGVATHAVWPAARSSSSSSGGSSSSSSSSSSSGGGGSKQQHQQM